MLPPLFFDATLAVQDQGAPASPAAQSTQTAPPPKGEQKGDTKAPGNPLGGFLVPMLLIFAIFYFVLIMPERKKQRARQALLGGVKKGDKVMTTSGLYGTVAQVQEDVVTLQVADGVRLRFSRQAIQNVLSEESKETPTS